MTDKNKSGIERSQGFGSVTVVVERQHVIVTAGFPTSDCDTIIGRFDADFAAALTWVKTVAAIHPLPADSFPTPAGHVFLFRQVSLEQPQIEVVALCD